MNNTARVVKGVAKAGMMQMTEQRVSQGSHAKYQDNLQAALAQWPAHGGQPATAVAPGVADVMHGIGEDSHSLILTATIGLSFAVSAWPLEGSQARMRFLPEGQGGPGHDLTLPIAVLEGAEQKIVEACRATDCEWALPIALVMARALADGVLPRQRHGYALLVQTDFPPDADWGRRTVLASAALSALCRTAGVSCDSIAKARLCSDAVSSLTGLRSLRTALTSLAGPADGSLLQVHLHPKTAYEPLSLPPGIMIQPIRTSLTRPVKLERLVETRLCVEMAQQVLDSNSTNGPAVGRRLCAITTAEYVEGLKALFPQKISGQSFLEQFGALSGLNGSIHTDEVYKIRSRAEHHIYEQPRVTQFISALTRARRNSPHDALIEAGDLMYASHWSHSQRCGIGGVEADRVVSMIRQRGPANGLYGAKVTGSGDGGEMVVLMRNDPQAHQALAAALADARNISERMVHLYHGSLPGAELAWANA